MALSAFDDKSKPPKPEQLAEVLGDSNELWRAIVAQVNERYGPVEEQWGFSGKAWGWGLRLKQRKRAILYLTPSEGFFYVGLALGQQAYERTLASRPPKWYREVLERAPRYAEGYGVRVEVHKHADLEWIEKFAAAKMGK